MSGTTTTPMESVTTVSTTASSDSLWTPQMVIGLIGMLVFAGTVAAVLYGTSGEATKSQTIGGVIAIAGIIVGFYFQSSLGSQKKDERAATTTTTPPAAATTTTTVATP